jgi:hypothetical protein
MKGFLIREMTVKEKPLILTGIAGLRFFNLELVLVAYFGN